MVRAVGVGYDDNFLQVNIPCTDIYRLFAEQETRKNELRVCESSVALFGLGAVLVGGK